jgi:hypothetical protein
MLLAQHLLRFASGQCCISTVQLSRSQQTGQNQGNQRIQWLAAALHFRGLLGSVSHLLSCRCSSMFSMPAMASTGRSTCRPSSSMKLTL